MKTFNMKPASKVTSPADKWVAASKADVPEDKSLANVVPFQEAAAEPMKRFTIDVSESLHRRIKAQCATRGVKMADVIRDMLEKEFPA